MMEEMLIIYGTDSVDEIPAHPVTESKLVSASIVTLIDKEGKIKTVKGESQIGLDFINVSDDVEDFRFLLRRLYITYKETHPDNSDLAHAFVGQWLFHWMYTPDGDTITPESTLSWLAKKDMESIRKSAESFIEKDFGMSSTVVLRSDGSRIN